MQAVKYIGALLAMAFSSMGLTDSNPAPTVIGTAYDQENGRFLYTEQHFCSPDSRLCTVEYRDSFGVIIAQKWLDYSDSLISPSLVMNDYRQNSEVSVSSGDADDTVVDAGFDNYVRSIWDELFSGEAVRFPFLVLGFDKPFKMRVDQEENPSCDRDNLCLLVSLDSWLLGMLTDPIELSYSRDSRKLVRFSGLSNIKGETGETLMVDIHYQYENDSLPALLQSQSHQGPSEFIF
ncbi:MAG: hypothetical protein V7754_09115 [Halioglobus sp.]